MSEQPLTWTAAVPTVPGLYWYYNPTQTSPRIWGLYVLADPYMDRLYVDASGDSVINHSGNGQLWYGPLPLPPDPPVGGPDA